MHEFLQQVFSGLAAGSVYASVALALVMIYRSTDLVNFAQGEMAMFSTYIAWTLVNAGLPFWGAFALTLAVSFARRQILRTNTHDDLSSGILLERRMSADNIERHADSLATQDNFIDVRRENAL